MKKLRTLIGFIFVSAISVFAGSYCDGKTLYSAPFVPSAAWIMGSNPMNYTSSGLWGASVPTTATQLTERSTFPNGVLVIQWPTSPVNYLFLPLDQPWTDHIVREVSQSARDNTTITVSFCFDNSAVRVVNYIVIP
ncbi:MAG: hypothetical protein AUK31_04810 [Fibrobacteres bacterium CG2_30_45_31]|nr:MAG: hypothetical protein AUK31_04810 [Fibrobacteres bacterium CG2_30_45_31]